MLKKSAHRVFFNRIGAKMVSSYKKSPRVRKKLRLSSLIFQGATVHLY